jgi:hypothetical protein
VIGAKNTLHLVERELIALHESCHAIAAIEMGLPVAWVDINQPKVATGRFVAAVFIPKRTEFPEDAEAVAVSLAAPSGWRTGNEELDYYAGLELSAALEIAGANGIDPLSILDQVKWIIDSKEDDIYEMRNRLVNGSGRVELLLGYAEGGE